ncbi:MAG: Topoisomerase [uncultured bacterium]|nr:MAG: Topoisomerase [uncultured bacterium]
MPSVLLRRQGEYHTMKTLHFRGADPYKINTKSIAIVGSRRMTRYGREAVDKFVCDFVANGITTISGFMYGIDTEVHQKTIDYGGKTIAVFGCGLDVIYPSENKKIYDQIIEGGGSVVSEYEDSAKPHLWKFPQRNKIVVSLASFGVLVIEAGENSGSLVTAKIAKKLGKKIWAVPGPINSKVSVGCNGLIKSGDAIMATSVNDIVHTKLINKNEEIRIQNFENKQEEKIYKILEFEALDLDEISQKLSISVVEIGSTLSIMGIKGLVTESGGKYYLNK